mgnify:CR=1 FL=1
MSSLPYGKKGRKYEETICGEFEISPIPRTYMERAQHFSKSQGIYIGRKVYMMTRTSLGSVLHS